MLTWIVLFLLAAISTPASAAGVAGIDFGHEFMKVALVKPGQSFDIATNVASKRKTAVSMAFNNYERLYGSDVDSLLARKPHQVITSPQKLLGRAINHPSVTSYIDSTLNATILSRNSRNGIDFILPSECKAFEGTDKYENLFSAEEVVGQILAYAKDFTEVYAESNVDDAVITVPSYFTQSEKLALLDAAELAGFNVLTLVEENTAAAVQYSIDRLFENETHYLIIYNMGYESTQVTVLAMDAYTISRGGKKTPVGQTRVLSKAWDAGIGGRWLDLSLFNYVCDELNAAKSSKFPAELQGDIRNHLQSALRIRKAITKAREVLSANEEFSFSIDTLPGDVDFRIKLTRAILASAADSIYFWQRSTAVLDDAVRRSGVPVGDLSAVELIGGAVRTPQLQTHLQAHMKEHNFGVRSSLSQEPLSVGFHMNGDEVMALGAAFVATNRSASFRVRNVGIVDVSPFAIDAKIRHLKGDTSGQNSAEETADADWELKETVLFKAGGFLDTSKRVTLVASHDLSVDLAYEPFGSFIPLNTDESSEVERIPLPPGTPEHIASFGIGGISDLWEQESVRARGPLKVQLTFDLDFGGIVRLVRAEGIQEFTEDVMTKVTVTPSPSPSAQQETEENADASPSTEPDAEKNEEEELKDAENEKRTEEPKEEEEKSTKEKGKKEKKKEKKPSPTTTTVPVPTKKTKRYTLSITPSSAATDSNTASQTAEVAHLSSADRVHSIMRLRALQEQDNLRFQLDEARNNVESYMYTAREKRDNLEERWDNFSTQQERDNVQSVLSSVEDWVMFDSSDASYEDCIARLAEIKAVFEPVFTRIRESESRTELVERAEEVLTAVKTVIRGWVVSHPQITQNETLGALELVDAFESWWNTTLEEQRKLSNTDDPVLLYEDAESRMKELSSYVMKLNRKPKPKAKAKPESKKKKSSQKAENAEKEEESKNQEVEENERKEGEQNSETVEKDEINVDVDGVDADNKKDIPVNDEL